MKTKRLDQLLVERGMFPSRQRAQAAIMAGVVYVDGHRSEKAGTSIAVNASIEVRGDVCPYVSRGGMKLAAALRSFPVDPAGMVALDVGASTGGFTDCLLQAGAARVYAVDVGYGQLDWSLRNDERVVVMERTNARYLTKEDISEPIDIIVSDVSFIGLEKIFPAIAPLLKGDGVLITLVKPQFEAGRADVGKGGVVRDAGVHKRVLHSVGAAAVQHGLRPLNVIPSPITGPRGNVEYLLYALKRAADVGPHYRDDWAAAVERAVESAAPLRRGGTMPV